MPEYIYIDANGHERIISHGMTIKPVVICPECAELMHRKPQRVAVNWGGLPPHQEGTRPPAIQNMITNEVENREKFLQGADTNQWNEFHK